MSNLLQISKNLRISKAMKRIIWVWIIYFIKLNKLIRIMLLLICKVRKWYRLILWNRMCFHLRINILWFHKLIRSKISRFWTWRSILRTLKRESSWIMGVISLISWMFSSLWMWMRLRNNILLRKILFRLLVMKYWRMISLLNRLIKPKIYRTK